MRINTNRKLALRVLSTATFLAMVSSVATAAFADTYDLTKGSVTVNAKSNGTYVTQKAADGSFCTNESGDTLNDYKDETPVTLTTEGKEEKNNTASIYTEKGVSTTVTLDNVNIDASGTGKAAISTDGKVTLELDGNNTLTGGDGHAALEKSSNVNTDHTLTLQDETGKTGSLTANGGAGGAGIGASADKNHGYADYITITGGTITATGGKDAAGIGGAAGSGHNGGNAGEITISGKNTTVTANGGAGGAGIGGGKGDGSSNSGQSGEITVKDGAHVEATGGAGGAGIGGGDGSKGGFGSGLGILINITGEGTTVTATGGKGGAGIGGGKGGDGFGSGQGTHITVEDGAHVEATGGEGGAGIGGGKKKPGTSANAGSGYTITISDKETSVTANGNGGGAGIGGGNGGYGAKITVNDGTVTATGGKGAAGIGSGVGSQLGSSVDITGGKVTATGGAGEAAGIGNGENDAGTSTVNISATNAALDVTAVTQGSGEAITGENGVTMASLTNDFSGVVRFFRSTNHYNTVHNGKYVGMDDNNADEHKETDAHIWGSTEIIRQATPTEQGILRHHCAVDGCKGYYDEFFDYVAPAEPVTPAPTDPDTPDVPGTSDSTPGTPAQSTPAQSTPAQSTPAQSTPVQDTPADAATADAVPGAATAEEVSVTPSGAQSVTAAALPQTGANWLAAVGSAISGIFLLAAGFVLDRKSHRQN